MHERSPFESRSENQDPQISPIAQIFGIQIGFAQQNRF
jgi:hypothetical protein